MVKLLLENKSPLNATDVAGYTALHHGENSIFYKTNRGIRYSGFARRDQVLSCLNQPGKQPTQKYIANPLSCYLIAISEGHGDTALTLLKAGAETDKKDVDGQLAIDLAPDTKVRYKSSLSHFSLLFSNICPLHGTSSEI
jgi:hypothetical protein